MSTELTLYEQKASTEVELWRAKPPSGLSRALDKVTKPIQKPMSWVMERSAIKAVMQGALNLTMDAATWSVSEKRVLDAYREKGYELDRLEDIRTRVSLEDMDRQALKLGKVYRASLATEGAGMGLAGIVNPPAALAADVVAVTSASCRAAAHFAATYGYRTETPAERAFALAAVSGAASATMAMKEEALAELSQVAIMAAKKKTWEQLEEKQLVQVVQKLAEKLSQNLTKAKLGQLMAVASVVIGGSYNAWYMTQLSDWGYYTFRDRHLQEKLGTWGNRQPAADSGAGTGFQGKPPRYGVL